jgi:hypothetical protein
MTLTESERQRFQEQAYYDSIIEELQAEVVVLRLVRQRVVEFAERCIEWHEMTLRSKEVLDAVEHLGRTVLEIVEQAEAEGGE